MRLLIVCSERLSKVSSLKAPLIYNMTVRFFYPTLFNILKQCRFLYYYSSVILNLSKNSFFLKESCNQLFLSSLSLTPHTLALLEHSLFLESGCKGTGFFDNSKTFPRKISVFIALFLITLQIKLYLCTYTLLYNI